MYVKICGVTSADDARMVARAGADLIGVNFWPKSSRHVSLVRADEIACAAKEVAPDIDVVGVFVNQSPLEIIQACDCVELSYVQLHGDEPPELVAELDDVIKAFRLAIDADVARIADYSCEMVLLDAPGDAYGGSGRVGRWDLARRVVDELEDCKVLLAGGLNPDNVAAAVAEVRPFGVDVASGVERAPGIKDPELVRRFIDRAKGSGG